MRFPWHPRFPRAPENETPPAGDGKPAEQKPPEPAKPTEQKPPAGEKPRSAEAAVVDEVAGLKKTVKELGEHVGFGKSTSSSATPPARPWWDPFGAY